ncbi:molybdopterin-dependent oxidoreductase [Campylobacter sp. RM12637]|uniref:molybdopterin-dependent oxidoreductase n=1 Tax=Campylobacter sp. RM12637 TaxID=2735734 RepID=UPI0030150C17|nr:molybdopterin-dependent oxidoreductase [Campylobacter sp. RM12637]
MKKHLIATRVGAFYLEDNKITPFIYDEAPTDLINHYTSRINHSSRIKNPCVRRGFLDGSKDRLNDEFIEISWDKAFELIANNLKKYYEKYGSSSIYAESYEWGGVGKIGWGRMLIHRLINALGGGVFELGDYSTGSAIASMPYVFGSSCVYERATDYKEIIKHAKVVVFWGANPIITSKIAHDIPMHEHEKYLKQMAENKDIEVIFIDIRANESAKMMNATTLTPNSNSDMAMAIGMCNYLYTNKLYDKEFIESKTTGFDTFKDYFLGINDGVNKDLEWASKICGISKTDLENLALKLKNNPSNILLGRSIQRQLNGEFNYLAIICLAAMCGHIGKDGLGIEFNLSSGCKGESAKNTEKLSDINALLGEIKGKNHYIPSSRLSECLLKPNTKSTYKDEEIIYPDIKLMINACGSYLTHQPNSNESLKALNNLECIITLEPFWTAQAKMSDIVLPIAIEGERYDIEQSTNKEIIFALKPIKEPFYNSKSDFEICKEIAKRFNKSYEFCRDLDELDLVKLAYLDIKERYFKKGIILSEFDEFLEKSYEKVQGLSELEPFTRFKNIKNINLSIKNNIAKYEQKDELLSEYPLFLTSAHSPYRLHSQLHNSDIRDSENDLEPVYLHKDLAIKKGIKQGDIVRVFNDRGEILVGARIICDINPNNILIFQGAWWQIDGKRCLNGNVNVLTSSSPSSAVSNSNTAHTCKVDIEKFNGIKNWEKDCFKAPKIIKNS